MVTMLKIGGMFHLLCAVLHIIFPRMFNWYQRLAPLPDSDRSVISINLNIMNYCLMFFWIVFAVIPFFHAEALMNTALGKTLLTGIVAFWFMRIFILKPVYEGISTKESIVSGIVFVAGGLLFAVPWIKALFG